MPKRYLQDDVLTAARKRVEWTFDNFAKVYVSFSAGKDSTVMLHLVGEEARKRGRRFGLLLIDLEGRYRPTIEHARNCYDMYADIVDAYWVCLPIALRNAVSVYEPKWLCWEPGKEDAWIRQLPEGAINDQEFFPFYRYGMEFEEFVPEFGEWYSEGESTACLVGIRRTDESLNRTGPSRPRRRSPTPASSGLRRSRRTPTTCTPSTTGALRTCGRGTRTTRTAPCNRLYDLMGMAGLTIHQMRICQPYGDDQRRGLWLFHLIEPQTWARVVARVNGANGGALYVQEWGNVNGYRKITKPAGHTWESFATDPFN